MYVLDDDFTCYLLGFIDILACDCLFVCLVNPRIRPNPVWLFISTDQHLLFDLLELIFGSISSRKVKLRFDESLIGFVIVGR